MFLSTRILNALIKKAYASYGLTVAQTDELVYIAGSYWEMDVRREFLPKKVLAKIIELTGELPEPGKRYCATKEGNQYEEGYQNVVDDAGFTAGIEKTKLYLEGKQRTIQRIFQAEDGIYLVNDAFAEIADNAEVKCEKGETRVDAPMYNPQRGLLWKNNVARFRAAWRSDEDHKRLLNELAIIDLTEDVPGEEKK